MDKRLIDITDPSVITAADNCNNLCFELINNMYDGLALVEVTPEKIRALYLNERYFECIGYAKEQYLPFLDNVTVTLFEDDEERIISQFKKYIKSDETFMCEVRSYRNDGSVCWLHIRARTVDFVKSEGPVLLASINDVTERKEIEHKLNINRERYRILEQTAGSSAFLFEYDVYRDIMTFSPGANREDIVIDGYRMYLRHTDRIHKNDINYFYSVLCKACRKEARGYVDVRAYDPTRDGYLLCRIVYSSVADEYGAILSVLGRLEIMGGELGVSSKQLSCSSAVNSCSPADAENAVEQISDRVRGDAEGKFLMVADIDDLSVINRCYGAATGANAVKIAEELLKSIFTDAVIFRYLGDEFVIWVENTTQSDIHEMFDKLNAAAATVSVCCDDSDDCMGSVAISFSAGAAWTHLADKADINDYFITADNALYNAKRDGKRRMYSEKIIFS